MTPSCGSLHGRAAMGVTPEKAGTFSPLSPVGSSRLILPAASFPNDQFTQVASSQNDKLARYFLQHLVVAEHHLSHPAAALSDRQRELSVQLAFHIRKLTPFKIHLIYVTREVFP